MHNIHVTLEIKLLILNIIWIFNQEMIWNIAYFQQNSWCYFYYNNDMKFQLPQSDIQSTQRPLSQCGNIKRDRDYYKIVHRATLEGLKIICRHFISDTYKKCSTFFNVVGLFLDIGKASLCKGVSVQYL